MLCASFTQGSGISALDITCYIIRLVYHLAKDLRPQYTYTIYIHTYKPSL